MNRPDREPALAVLGTLGLVLVVAALTWVGLRTGDLATGPRPTAVPTPSPAESPTTTPAPTPTATPSATPSVVLADPALTSAFAEEVASLGGSYALAWRDAEGLHLLGSAPGSTAWSTIKVPLAVAALEADPAAATWTEVEAALTRSDNAAADALWAAKLPLAGCRVTRTLSGRASTFPRSRSRSYRPLTAPHGVRR